MIKRLGSFALMYGCVISTYAQATLQFSASLSGTNVVPPSTASAYGEGTFQLTGNSFAYQMTLVYGEWRAALHGPAEPGVNGPLLFDLGRPNRCFAPSPDPNAPPAHCDYFGSVQLLPDQIPNLVEGRWYVQAVNPIFGEFSMRGQIEPVPEPASIVLIITAAAAVCVQVKLGRTRV